MKNEKKKQHTVPVTYLKHFTPDDGMLYIYDKVKREYRRQPPEDTTIQKYFYSHVQENGELNFELEDMLGRYIEKDYNLFIKKILHHRVLDREDKEYISWFAAFQIARTTAFREIIEQSEDSIRKQLTKLSIYDEQTADNLIRNYKREYPKEEYNITPDVLLNFIQSENYHIVVPKEYSIRVLLESAKALQKTLYDMDIYFLFAGKHSTFITSDNPFFIRPPRSISFYGYGYGTPDLEKTFPLTDNVCLLIGGYGDRVNFLEIDRVKVRHINLRTAKSAHRYIIGGVKAMLVRVVDELKY
jgi:hypothetical protein